jgi:beta-N-acetylhexosaminidase
MQTEQMLPNNLQHQLSKYTLENKIGQMLMFGFPEAHIKQDDAIVLAIEEYNLGGVILFNGVTVFNKDSSRKTTSNILSPSQVIGLNQQLQDYANGSLFIAIDQEGGSVARLSPELGFQALLAPEAVAKLNATERQAQIQQMVTMVKDSGFNIDFFPTVDLNTNPNNPIIGMRQRSFSDDPQIVIDNAREYLTAFAAANIIGCLKHFPGHGSSHHDSHEGFVDITQTWDEKELLPYKHFIASNQCQMIMTGHLVNTHLDPTYPATLSHYCLQSLLREKLGYDGVIITDDLQMKAIADHYTVAQAMELAINAGADILMFCNNCEPALQRSPQKIHETLLSLVEQGKISEHRIHESFMRIVKLKQQLSMW